MSKRFTQTEKWRDRWFMGLMPNTKLILIYICDNCDSAGIWEPNFIDCEFHCGFARTTPKTQIDWRAVYEELNAPVESNNLLESKVEQKQKVKVMLLAGGKWWITGFIAFQCGLNEGRLLYQNVPVFIPIFKSLEKHGLLSTFKEIYPNKISEKPYVHKGGRHKGEAEEPALPLAATPTLDEVCAWPEAKNFKRPDLEHFYHHYQAQGWKVRGTVAANPRSLLAKWKIVAAKTNGEMSVWEMTKIIESIDVKIAELKTQTYRPQGASMDCVRPEAIKEMRSLALQRSEMKAKIVAKSAPTPPPPPLP